MLDCFCICLIFEVLMLLSFVCVHL